MEDGASNIFYNWTKTKKSDLFVVSSTVIVEPLFFCSFIKVAVVSRDIVL